jgi:cystathionine beta-synthase
LGSESFEQIPVVGQDGDIKGVVTLTNMTSKMLQGTIKASDPVTRVCYEQFNMVKIFF